MIIPPKLCQGDKIGFFSPSKPATYFAKQRFLRAQEFLTEKGYELVAGKLTGKSDFYRSGTIQERVDELNNLIRDPSIKCIMATMGGMNSNSLLPYIDYKSLISNPKIIIGYSDTTAILLAIYNITGIQTYYGPCLVSSFGEFAPIVDETFKYFQDIVSVQSKLPIKLLIPKLWTDEYIDWNIQKESKKLKNNHWLTIKKGVAQGRLIGGNLNTLQGIWGSSYMPHILEGDILFIEDSTKNAADIERSFSLLKINGVFGKISGLILGKHELFDDCGCSKAPYEILLEVIGEELDFPILADFDCCHSHPMFTIPLGCTIELNTIKQEVTILE